ncbi:MAG TPA: TetR family transcriptional regulator [Desulfobacteraceae bacterium]|nr:TetR family transcriptional regulator [Desulfobacteraceae bacterium]
MVTKRVKQNRYKPESAKTAADGKQKASGSRKGLSFFRIIVPVFVVAAMSLAAIWAHDAVVQSPFFTIQNIHIEGLNRVTRDELITRAGLDQPANLFEIHLAAVERQLVSHPWVARATVRRDLFTGLDIRIEEQEPLAIVTIENLADIIINTQGVPFKEYEPEKDKLYALPVISGVDLSLSNNTYLFEGELFNAIMDLLKVRGLGEVKHIHGDENFGVTIQSHDAYNRTQPDSFNLEGASSSLIPIKLGFGRFEEKLARAQKISRYMATHFPSKVILAMDLFNIEKIFIKTEDALHNTIEKGV